MKKVFSVAFIMISMITLTAQETPRSRENFNQGWKFVRYFHSYDENAGSQREPADLQEPGTDDSNWRIVELPHDWAIEGPFSDSLENSTGLLPWKGIGWYRKQFNLGSKDRNKRIYIDFDGAMANAKIWLNGKYVGEWPYGYASFRLDLTPYVIFDSQNTIAVRLNTKSWDSRWYPGAGIYRNVWLVKTPQVHVAYNGIYCTTPEISDNRAMLSVGALVENHLNGPEEVSISARVFRLDEKFLPVLSPASSSSIVKATIPAHNNHDFRLDIPVEKPALWNVYEPNLYMIEVTVTGGGNTDVTTTNFGFRKLLFTPREGLYINGKRTVINGVCNHHDLGALGAAFNNRAAERQLGILKEMGCNAIRTSHNPPAPELLDLCDKMGFLVEDESFDAWRTGKKPNDYSILFDAWHARDLRNWVRRDRNHPSVIMWSIGNELGDQKNNPFLSGALKNIVREEDNSRPVTAGCDNPASITNGFGMNLDVFGMNYHIADYAKFFETTENSLKPIHSSESSSTVSSRGEYFFPVVEGNLNNNLPGKGIFQVSSYDLAFPSWASTPDKQFEINDRYPGVLGEFVWTGFDYLGEPTPYSGDLTGVTPGTDAYNKMKKMLDANSVNEIPSRSSYFGIMDIAGFKKDRFYLYQSRWRPDFPMAHILPHWNWPERKGQVTPVHVYTSGDEAELFLNGKSLGKKKKGQYEYRLRWDDVVYQPGELRVIAYKNGQRWAEDVMKTAGSAAKLSASADRNIVGADGEDLVYVTLRIEDKNGILVPRSNNLVNFTVDGPAKIIATDNGDATSHEPFQTSSRKAYNGMALAIVKPIKGSSGSFTVKAVSKGLKESSVVVNIE